MIGRPREGTYPRESVSPATASAGARRAASEARATHYESNEGRPRASTPVLDPSSAPACTAAWSTRVHGCPEPLLASALARSPTRLRDENRLRASLLLHFSAAVDP